MHKQTSPGRVSEPACAYRALGDCILLQHGKTHIWIILKVPAHKQHTVQNTDRRAGAQIKIDGQYMRQTCILKGQQAKCKDAKPVVFPYACVCV